MIDINRIEIKIPGHPPSVNNLFMTIGKRRIKSMEYRDWESAVQKAIFKHPERVSMKKYKDRLYKLEIFVVKNSWFCQNGKPIIKDTPNFIKALEDAVCRFTGWDDRYNYETRVRKLEEVNADDHTIARFYFV